MWDVHYEDLAMHDVPTAVQLNQFYFAKPGDPPATMRFERIYFQNITVRAGGGGSSGSGGDTSAVVNLDCDTKYSGVNNCDVVFEHVHFIGLSTNDEQHGMVCKGVKGTATVRLTIVKLFLSQLRGTRSFWGQSCVRWYQQLADVDVAIAIRTSPG